MRVTRTTLRKSWAARKAVLGLKRLGLGVGGADAGEVAGDGCLKLLVDRCACSGGDDDFARVWRDPWRVPRMLFLEVVEIGGRRRCAGGIFLSREIGMNWHLVLGTRGATCPGRARRRSSLCPL